jgi:fatty-acyl-CoA synthase
LGKEVVIVLRIKPVKGMQDIQELEKTPWEQRIRERSVYELLANSAQKKQNDIALMFLPTCALDEEPIRLTYRQLFGRITQAANMFNSLGAGPGDAVSMLLPLLPQAHFTMWGSQAAGVANPINFLLSPDQIADLLNAAEAKVLVALGPHPVLDIWQKVEAIRGRVPSLKAILQVGGSGDKEEGILSFDQEIVKYPADRLVSGRVFSLDDIATYFHTGGTTGSPKLAQHTQGNTIYAVWAVAHMWGYTEETIQTNMLPLFHVAGSIITALTPLCAGAQIIILSPGGLRNPQALQNHWKLVEKYRPTHIGGVPTNLVQLLSVPIGEADQSSVKFCVTGGAALPVEVERTWEEKYGIPLSQMYGMTEAGSLVAITPVHGKPVPGAVGLRLPYEKIHIAGLNPDGSPGEECRPNQTGVVLIHGPNVFPGYKDPVHNRGTLTEDGWLISGDLGYMDETGNMFLTGRSKDLIIRSAHNIDPSIIEESMVKHPAVALCAAVGKPDAYAGELPVAYVQLKPGATATEDELLRFISDRIAERPAKPKDIVIIDQMPLTAVGKIFKPALRWKEIQKVFERELSFLVEEGIQASVSVGEDKHFGVLATIRLKGSHFTDKSAIEANISKKLNEFSLVRHRIEWGGLKDSADRSG